MKKFHCLFPGRGIAVGPRWGCHLMAAEFSGSARASCAAAAANTSGLCRAGKGNRGKRLHEVIHLPEQLTSSALHPQRMYGACSPLPKASAKCAMPGLCPIGTGAQAADVISAHNK